MSVYKRQDRKRRPWCFEFRENGTLYKQSGFGTMKAAQDAEAMARREAKLQRPVWRFRRRLKTRLEFVQAYYPKELTNNITRLRKFAAWEHLDCRDITSEMVRQRLIELKNEGMKQAYVNKHLVALKSVFQMQFEEGRLPRNPCRGVKMMPVERFVKYIPPADDIEKVLALAGELDRTYLTVIWQCAARVREINNLTWEDIDFQRRYARLWTRKKRGGNLTDRLVDMTDRCFNALKKAQWLRNKHSPYVFTNPLMAQKYPEAPARWKYDYRDKFFHRLCRLAGVREMGYHALRHHRASEMADQGRSLPYIKEQLGHEDISTTSLYLQSLGIKR